MVNYRIKSTGNMVPADTPLGGTDHGYVEAAGSIIEIKTNQVVKTDMPMRNAKELVRHLNFGGGFDGDTPSFFLTNILNNTARMFSPS